jgi:hypothetical protein
MAYTVNDFLAVTTASTNYGGKILLKFTTVETPGGYLLLAYSEAEAEEIKAEILATTGDTDANDMAPEPVYIKTGIKL